MVFYLQQASYISNNLCRTLPGCTLDVLKLFRKLEQLLIFFLCLLCGQTRCCWNGYSHPANVRVRSRSWSVYATAASTNHGHEVQQVHPGLVGLGVSQREEGRQFEPHRVPSITALKTAVTSQLSTFSFQIFHPGTIIIKGGRAALISASFRAPLLIGVTYCVHDVSSLKHQMQDSM